jgi:NAD(P)-binding Rossmann-like domain
VIVGGGFAGLAAATALRKAPVRITGMLSAFSFEWLRDLTKSSNRSPVHQPNPFSLETNETAK